MGPAGAVAVAPVLGQPAGERCVETLVGRLIGQPRRGSLGRAEAAAEQDQGGQCRRHSPAGNDFAQAHSMKTNASALELEPRVGRRNGSHRRRY
jgi:hypothetical protein